MANTIHQSLITGADAARVPIKGATKHPLKMTADQKLELAKELAKDMPVGTYA